MERAQLYRKSRLHYCRQVVTPPRYSTGEDPRARQSTLGKVRLRQYNMLPNKIRLLIVNILSNNTLFVIIQINIINYNV